MTDKFLLIDADEPGPVRVNNPAGASAFLLTGDHAGNAIPRALGGLGVDPAELGRHIAIDIGIEALGHALAPTLDAVFFRQHYSRLVIDCNRDPTRADAMPETSDGTRILANIGLAPKDRDARIAAIHTPYHDALAAIIADRASHERETILIALHSFTPQMGTRPRPWHIGVLHDGGDTRFAQVLLATLGEDETLVVGDNEPYRMDLIDYTVPHHAYQRRLSYAEIEIRQDLLDSPADIERWRGRLAAALRTARHRLVR